MLYLVIGVYIFYLGLLVSLVSFLRDKGVSPEKKKRVMQVIAFSLSPLAFVLIAAPSDFSQWSSSFRYLGFSAAIFASIGITTVMFYGALLPRFDAMVSEWLLKLHKAIFGDPADFPLPSSFRRVRRKRSEKKSDQASENP